MSLRNRVKVSTPVTGSIPSVQGRVLSDKNIEYIDALMSIVTVDQKGEKIKIDTKYTFDTTKLISSDLECSGKCEIDTISTDNIQSKTSSTLTINKTKFASGQSTIKVGRLEPVDIIVGGETKSGTEINVNNVIFQNDCITTRMLKSKSDVPIDINGVSIKDSAITTKYIYGADPEGVKIEGVTISKGIVTVNKIQGGLAGVTVENGVFRDDKLTIRDLKVVNIIENVKDTGVTIAGLKIVNGEINGVNFDTFGKIEIETLRVNRLESDSILTISSDIQFDNAKFKSSGDGFTIDDVVFKNGDMYVNKIKAKSDLENYEDSQKGITIGGVKLNNGDITATKLNVADIETTTLMVDTIMSGGIDSGVTVGGIIVKENKLMLPSTTGDESVISMYNQSGQIILESPDGSVYTPPSVSHWMDWDIQNNDPFVSINNNYTRFTIVEQSAWINVNIHVTISNDVSSNYDTLWISLPIGYKSTRNKFQSFCIFENDNNEIIIGNVFINGNVNNDLIYFKLNKPFEPEHEYTIYANMVYEYSTTSMNTINRMTPWQTWFPIRKDVQIKTIAVNNTRYYKFGSNVWLSIDVNILMSGNITSTKKHAYISLPPKTHAKSIYFTNPVLIDSDTTTIGSMSTGISSSDVKLGTNILRITNPDGFENNTSYTIKGQLIFEEANASAINFFFDKLNHEFGILENNNYGFIGDTVGTQIEFIHNIDTTTISNINWLSYFMNDSFNIHIANDDGFSMYTQMLIVPHRNISRIDNPWRVTKTGDDIRLQFTVDGNTYNDQLIIGNTISEDPY